MALGYKRGAHQGADASQGQGGEGWMRAMASGTERKRLPSPWLLSFSSAGVCSSLGRVPCRPGRNHTVAQCCPHWWKLEEARFFCTWQLQEIVGQAINLVEYRSQYLLDPAGRGDPQGQCQDQAVHCAVCRGLAPAGGCGRRR